MIILAPCVRAQNGITITVIPALAPNAYGSPNWNAWVSNATTAIINGDAIYGDHSSPSFYHRAPAIISVTNNIVTGYPSWDGLADPGDVFGAAYSQEYGNRLQFGIDIKGGTNLISISQLSFTAQSSDPGNSLAFSFPQGSYSYSASYIGIIYSESGNTYITSGPATQLVNEIVGRGSGNAWAVYDTSGNIASEQSNIVSYASQISTQPFTFSGTYTIDGVSGSSAITLNPLPPPPGLTITVIPALAPNAYGSPNWNAWVSNATTAIINGDTTYGDPSSPSYYQRAPAVISVTNNIVTGFPSWEGLADPGDIFGAAYSQEYGNRLQFGIDIKGGTNLISISQLSFTAQSTDPSNSLAFSFPQGSYSYSPSYIGIIYGSGGNTYITSGPATQLVNEIVGRGSGNAWAVYDTSGDIASEQSNIFSFATSQISTQPFSFSGTYTIDGVSGSGAITLNSFPPPLGLTIAVTPSNTILIAWPNTSSGGFLQTNSDLTTSNWANYNGPVTTGGGTNSATFPTANGPLFFRLGQ